MQINLNCAVNINLNSCSLKEIVSSFQSILLEILQQLVYTVLLEFTERELSKRKTNFKCTKCGSDDSFKWKTRQGKKTSLLTIFGKITYPELQIYCSCCGKRKVLSRELLQVESRARIPNHTVRKLGLLGALTTYGVSSKITEMFGIKLNKMTIWRAVQKVGKSIKFDLDPNEMNIGEADGTGIPIRGIKKRGREIKIFLQLKKGGGCRIAGASIGKYESGWNKLFEPILKQFSFFKNFLLVTDGDSSILKGLDTKIEILFQRCLWHIPHQFKWYGWKDGANKKGVIWISTLTQLIDILDVNKLLDEDDACLKSMIILKEKRYLEIIKECRKQGWKYSANYLENAKDDLFKGVKNRLEGKTSSHAERVMRTLKMRTTVGKWKEESALNLIKIRLAYYYNDWND